MTNTLFDILYSAINEKKLDKIKEFIEIDKINVNITGPLNNSLLHYAVKHDTPEITQYLLDNGADINALNLNNNSLLHFATFNHNLTIVEILLKHNINKEYITLKNKKGETPLFYSYYNDVNFELIHLLVEYGGELLNQHINDVDKDGHTIITHIINTDRKNIMCFDVNNVYKYQPDIKIIRYLVKHGADVESKFKGHTCLHLALCIMHIETIYYLINEAHSNIFALNEYKNTCLHLSCYFDDFIEIKKLFVEKGIDINAQDKHGYTALMYAVQSINYRNNNDIITYLIKNGADTSIVNNDNETALYIAMKTEDEYFNKNSQNLLKHDVDVTIGKNIIPFIYIFRKDIDSMELLITSMYKTIMYYKEKH